MAAPPPVHPQPARPFPSVLQSVRHVATATWQQQHTSRSSSSLRLDPPSQPCLSTAGQRGTHSLRLLAKLELLLHWLLLLLLPIFRRLRAFSLPVSLVSVGTSFLDTLAGDEINNKET